MEYRNQDDEIGMPSSTLGYNSSPPPPSLRGSAFSRPTLPPSSSLISPRGGAGGGGPVGGGGAFGGVAGTRNGSIFGNSTPSAAPPSVTATTNSLNILRPAPAPVDHSSSHSHGKAPDPTPISSLSSAGLAAVGAAASSNSKTATSTAAPKSSAAVTNTVAAAPTIVDVSSRYRECLRNHAASIGGHVVDGCGEFMPNGEASTPEALKCAACGCHRSFHRKESDGENNAAANSYYRAAGAARVPLLLPPPHPQTVHHSHNPHTPKQFQLSGFPSSPSRAIGGSAGVVAFGGNTSGSGGTTTESSSEERIHSGAPTPTTGARRKRFRTKFTPEQKEKMLAFADRVGWRIQKQDEAVVEQFCSETGVRRQVLKVWMHNNKHTVRKHQQLPSEEEELLMKQQQHQQQLPNN